MNGLGWCHCTPVTTKAIPCCLEREKGCQGKAQFSDTAPLSFSLCLCREDDLPPKCSSTTKAFHADASSSENDTLTSSNTYNSRYWNDPKANHATDSFTRFSNSNDVRQSFSRSGSTNVRPVYANGGHPSPAPTKTLVVTANTAPSPQEMARSNGSVSRKQRPQHTHSYAVSQATLERIGAVPVMVPAQSRAGSLV